MGYGTGVKRTIMTETITVVPDGGERYVVRTRGHEFAVDQPGPGGTDSAPTPTELFVAGLVSCVAYYAGSYLTRHGLDRDGLTVSGDWDFATGRPARVGRVTIRITPPGSLAEDRIPAMLAVASHCTVHNSLGTPPDVSIDVTTTRPQHAGSTG